MQGKAIQYAIKLKINENETCFNDIFHCICPPYLREPYATGYDYFLPQ